jgi:hypothetical protein
MTFFGWFLIYRLAKIDESRISFTETLEDSFTKLPWDTRILCINTWSLYDGACEVSLHSGLWLVPFRNLLVDLRLGCWEALFCSCTRSTEQTLWLSLLWPIDQWRRFSWAKQQPATDGSGSVGFKSPSPGDISPLAPSRGRRTCCICSENLVVLSRLEIPYPPLDHGPHLLASSYPICLRLMWGPSAAASSARVTASPPCSRQRWMKPVCAALPCRPGLFGEKRAGAIRKSKGDGADASRTLGPRLRERSEATSPR